MLLAARIQTVSCWEEGKYPWGKMNFPASRRALGIRQLNLSPKVSFFFPKKLGKSVLKETGLHLKNVCYTSVVNSIKLEDYHYITLIMREVDTSYPSKPGNLEPQKNEGWTWMKPAFPALSLPEKTRIPSFQRLFNISQRNTDRYPGLYSYSIRMLVNVLRASVFTYMLMHYECVPII